MTWGMGPWGGMYPPPYSPYGSPYGQAYGGYWGYGPSKEQEKQMLLDSQKYLQEQLDQVNARIAELEKSE